MKTTLKKMLFKKVLVPIVPGCDQSSAINAARAIAGDGDVGLIGLVYIPKGQSLSCAAGHAQEVRQTLRKFSALRHIHRWTEVYATHNPWEEITRVVNQEKPDLLILEYPCQFEILETTPTEVLNHLPCSIAIVNQKIPEKLNTILLPIRGGPYAELALRTALSIKSAREVELTSLHMIPKKVTAKQDAAFRGIERVLKNLPEIAKEAK